MSSKVLTLLLSLAAQSGVYARPTGPRAMQAILLSATVALAALDENLDPGYQLQDLLAVAERRQGGFSRPRESASEARRRE